MKHEISPDKQTVESCLKQKSYYVDFYQREYVWSKETVEILLRDIFYEFELSYKIHKDEELTQEVLDLYNWYYMNVFITNYCCPVNFQTAQESSPKPFRIGLRGFIFKKQAP